MASQESLSRHVRFLYAAVVVLSALQVAGVCFSLYLFNSVRQECVIEMAAVGASTHAVAADSGIDAGTIVVEQSQQQQQPLSAEWNAENQTTVLPPSTRDKRALRDAEITRWRRKRGRKKRRSQNGSYNPHVDSDGDRTLQIEFQHKGSQGWVPVTSRIPVKELMQYCEDACLKGPVGPPGAPGLPGPPGLKGDKGDEGEMGDLGFPGNPGPKGDLGAPGYKGRKGEPGQPGKSGIPGLDGRDGLPGEPGLDGVPGRDGTNGIPGKDGIPGIPGIPGQPGINGTDGIPGRMGPIGPKGESGPPGMPGPRGKKGLDGKSGKDGTPGTQAWTFTTKENRTELLIAPKITDMDKNTTVLVKEGDNLRVRCAAVGTPFPVISWHREDGKTIHTGIWYNNIINGSVLNFTKAHRDHIGYYICTANNGVEPQAKKKVFLEVHFSPMITIMNDEIGSRNGSHAVLECLVQSFPEAITYWLREDGRIIDRSNKYRIAVSDRDDRYQVKMTLNITNLENSDFGHYKCESKNEMGSTQGIIRLYNELDPRYVRVRPKGATPVISGKHTPKLEGYEELCHVEECRECPEQKIKPCRDLSKKWATSEIYLNRTWPDLPPRINPSVLMEVGKPVFHRYTHADYGSWMQDLKPKDEKAARKYWVTLQNQSTILYEYDNKEMFGKDNFSKQIFLPVPFRGTGHVIFNGSLYYNADRTNTSTSNATMSIVRFPIDESERDKEGKTINLPHAAYTVDRYLYSTKNNFMDFAVDENGLWVIFGEYNSNNTLISKLNPNTLVTEYGLNISLDHQEVGDMFIIHGVLYAVDDVLVRTTSIRFAFDLYQRQMVDIPAIAFSNPFRMNTMISYNPRDQVIYTWDKGHQLTYPIRVNKLELTKDILGEAIPDNQ